MQNQKQEPSMVDDARTAYNLLYLALSAWSITIYLMMRRNTGKEHCGIRGILGLLFPVVFSVLTNDSMVLVVVPIYLVSLAIHRTQHLQAYMRGEVVHTQYSGYPLLGLKLRKDHDEIKAKTISEPLFTFFVGMALNVFSPGLGAYYMGGAGAMFFMQLSMNGADRKRIDQMNDSMIENRYFAERVRHTSRSF